MQSTTHSLLLGLVCCLFGMGCDPAPEQSDDKTCKARSCEAQNILCGKADNGCGKELNCGPCSEMVMVEMTDTVRLRSKYFLPQTGAPQSGKSGAPTLLYRTPYRAPGYYDEYYEQLAAAFNQEGYAFVLQDVRGTHNSQGDFYPFDYAVEKQDGHDTVSWMQQQPWCNGKIGTVGGSYEAFTALATAADNPGVHVVFADGPGEGITIWNRGGIINSGMLFYQAFISELDSPEVVELSDLVSNALHYDDLDQQAAGRTVSTWQDAINHPTPTDTFWNKARILGKLDQLCLPIYVTHSVTFGWDDPLVIAQGLWQHSCAQHRGNIRYIIGEFGHATTMVDFAYGNDGPAVGTMLDYLAKYLQGKEIDLAAVPKMQYHTDNDNTVRETTQWPPDVDQQTNYYLAPDELTTVAPSSESQTELSVDPEVDNPCETAQQAMFVSGPLDPQQLVAGDPKLILNFSGSGQDADLHAYLFAYDTAAPQDQAYQMISNGMLRARYRQGYDSELPLTADTVTEFEIAMSPLAHRFSASERLVLGIYGAICGWVENPHSGEPLLQQTQRHASAHTIVLGPSQLSRLVLPTATVSSSFYSRPPAPTELVQPELVQPELVQPNREIMNQQVKAFERSRMRGHLPMSPRTRPL